MKFDRRSFLGLGASGLAGCADEGPYFGNTNPPTSQQLICAAFDAGDSLDPAKAAIPGRLVTLFEGLTSYHPQTMDPAAGIATHYELSLDRLRVTLYLRGHPNPSGTAFSNTTSLPAVLTRGRPAPPDRTPIRWSDGAIITAHDVVYSWRRLLDPATAAPFSHLLYCVQNAREVNAGLLPPEKLGVRAALRFQRTLRVAGMEAVSSHCTGKECVLLGGRFDRHRRADLSAGDQRHNQRQLVSCWGGAFHGSSSNSSDSCACARAEEGLRYGFGAAYVLVSAQRNDTAARPPRRALCAEPCNRQEGYRAFPRRGLVAGKRHCPTDARISSVARIARSGEWA